MSDDESVSKIGMKPPHPGDFIKTEILDELHLSVARAADILGVRRATLSDLIHGKASLSPEMARYIRARVRAGGYTSTSEVVRSAIRLPGPSASVAVSEGEGFGPSSPRT